MFSFGNNSMGGTPQHSNQQQQQYASASPFGNNTALNSNQHSSPGTFSFANEQQQQQQQGTPQSSGLFGQRADSGQQGSSPFLSNSFGQQSQQQQPTMNSTFGSRSNFANNQQQQQPPQQFGTSQPQGPQNQQNPQSPYAFQSPQHRQHQQYQQNHLQQQTVDQQRQNLEQQSQNMTYLPGYLSRTKIVKPYKLPARQVEPGSPEALQEADTSAAFGTPSSKSGKDDTPSKGQASPVDRFSSSFFDERRDDASFSRAGSAAPGTPWRAGRESIFGAGGLRGGRQSATPAPASSGVSSSTPARKSFSESPGRSLRSASTPPTAAASLLPTSGAMEEDEDDDAPPQERLEDLAPFSSTSAFSNVARSNVHELSVQNTLPARASTSDPVLGSSPAKSGQSTSDKASSVSDRSSALNLAHRTVLVYGYPAWMEKVVLELFAAAGAIETIEAIDLTGSGSAQDQAASNAHGPMLPCCTRVRYAESYQALQALRRNGEVVAGACVVGVRWEDDNFHQIALTNGTDAIFRMEVFPSARFADMFKASTRQIAQPKLPTSSNTGTTSSSYSSATSPAKTGALSSFGGQTGNPSSNANANDSARMLPTSNSAYPAFGRPMSVINDPSVMFKPSASAGTSTNSPFRAASLLFGTGGAAPKSSPAPMPVSQVEKKSSAGVLGRITDGIFGW